MSVCRTKRRIEHIKQGCTTPRVAVTLSEAIVIHCAKLSKGESVFLSTQEAINSYKDY
mgnify:CR=1 FL=1